MSGFDILIFRGKKRLLRKAMLFMASVALLICITAVDLGYPMRAYADEVEGEVTTRVEEISSGTKIHFLTSGMLNGTDVIILESNGRFGMVDAGEDADYPDGTDPRYPFREGITYYEGFRDEVLNYMRKLGVNHSNFEFFIGTHPHSDHIGCADEAIREFRPQRVYTPEYKDEWITVSSALYDNLYVYDHLLQAAKDVGAVLIQNLDPSAPLVSFAPNDASASGDGMAASGFAADGNPCFTLGDMTIEIVNYDDSYKFPESYVSDANEFSWGVVVEAYGKKAFLSGDIVNYDGDEDNLIKPKSEGGYGLGDVDLLKLGHHGLSGSSTRDYLETLSPEIAIQTMAFSALCKETLDLLTELGVRHFDTSWAYKSGYESIVATFERDGISVNVATDETVWQHRRSTPYVTAYSNGLQQPQDEGWQCLNGAWYWFEEGSPSVLESSWVCSNGQWCYLGTDGQMRTGWQNIDGSWYFLGDSGVMQIGWLLSGGRWYYLGVDGAMVVGWLHWSGSWYYLDPSNDGAMATGWVYDGSEWYYLASSGSMQTGWLCTGGSWRYLKSSGAMATGWVYDGGAWYYLDPSGDGVMLTGWLCEGDSWYYLHSSGEMAVSQWVGGYYVGADGKWIP